MDLKSQIKKITLKRFLFLCLLAVAILVLIAAVWSFVYLYLPYKELEKQKKEFEIISQQVEEYFKSKNLNLPERNF